MTVGELREVLEEFDEESEVCAFRGTCEFRVVDADEVWLEQKGRDDSRARAPRQLGVYLMLDGPAKLSQAARRLARRRHPEAYHQMKPMKRRMMR